MHRFNLITDEVFTHGGEPTQVNPKGGKLYTEGILPMFLSHSDLDIVGRWNDIRVDAAVDGVLALSADTDFDDDEKSIAIAKKVSRGTINYASAGLIVTDSYYKGDIYYINEYLIYEASLTPIPANRGAKRTFSEPKLYINKDSVIDGESFDLTTSKKGSKLEFGGETLYELSDNLKNYKKMDKNKNKIEELDALKLEFKTKFDTLTTDLNSKTDAFTALELEFKTSTENHEANLASKDVEINELADTIKVFETAEKESLLEDARKAGKISEDGKEVFRPFSIDKLKEIFSNLTPQTKRLSQLTEEIKEDSTVKTFNWYLENDKDGLNKIMTANPALFEKILKA